MNKNNLDLKVIESMRQFAESYAKSTNTFFCSDLEVTESVIQGLSNNKNEFGAPLCPCRYYDNKEEDIIGNVKILVDGVVLSWRNANLEVDTTKPNENGKINYHQLN